MPSIQEYDQHLLASAPAPTKAQIQGGYDTRILREPSPAPIPRRNSIPSRQASTAPGHDLESANLSKEHIAPTSPASRTSFWRSTKGKLTVAVLAIVIIAAVVGGAVGGTVNKDKKTTSGSSSSDSEVGSGSSGGNNGGGGIGATPNSSTTIAATPSPASATTPVASAPTSIGVSSGNDSHGPTSGEGDHRGVSSDLSSQDTPGGTGTLYAANEGIEVS
jgi:hypothetical protein